MHSSLDASYVGSRGHKLQSRRPFNEPSLTIRQLCNPIEGGNPDLCDVNKNPYLNPFFGLPAFGTTFLGSNKNLSLWDLSRPFPEFGTITERGRNDGKSWYNSMQLVYRTRARKGLDLSVAYTLSKDIVLGDTGNSGDGFIDVQRNILNRSLTDDDAPHSLKVGSVWQLPFGKGHALFNTSNGFWSRVVSGWEHTMIITYVSGLPQGMPGGNVFYQKEAKLSNIDWSAPIVQGWLPCVARRSQTPNSAGVYSFSAGASWNDAVCGDHNSQSVLAAANFLDLNLSGNAHAPRFTNFRNGHLRHQSAPTFDMSLNKTTRFTERVSLQFRAEAFNLFNKFRYARQDFDNNTGNASFGSIIKLNVGDGSNVGSPRQIQLALKLLF
jgi:hypothetical protein